MELRRKSSVGLHLFGSRFVWSAIVVVMKEFQLRKASTDQIPVMVREW
jgi:hypothetical protein